MARRRVPEMFGFEEDTRPFNTVMFADPSTPHMATEIHTFNEPFSPEAHGEQRGFKPTFGSQSPWSNTHDGEEAWRDMNRKRGVASEEKD